MTNMVIDTLHLDDTLKKKVHYLYGMLDLAEYLLNLNQYLSWFDSPKITAA